MMRKALWVIGLVFAASFAPTIVRADDITYAVDVNIGGDTLTGTIVTDGNIGQLSPGDIVSYNLTDTDNFLIPLNNLNSVIVNPTLTISASSTSLFVNNSIFGPFQIEGRTGGTGAENVVLRNGFGLIEAAPAVYLANYGLATGDTVATALPGVPEIDPTLGSSALALMAGAILIIRGQRKISMPIA